MNPWNSLDAFLSAEKQAIMDPIRYPARFGLTYVNNKYNANIQAANDAKSFGHSVSSNFKRIQIYIRFIHQYGEEIASILIDMFELVGANEGTKFVQQVHLIESYKGAGFLSAVSLMSEISDFSAFRSPKQLFAYCGLDPASQDACFTQWL